MPVAFLVNGDLARAATITNSVDPQRTKGNFQAGDGATTTQFAATAIKKVQTGKAKKKRSARKRNQRNKEAAPLSDIDRVGTKNRVKTAKAATSKKKKRPKNIKKFPKPQNRR